MKIQTEVFRLPTNCFAEEDGTLVNSSRWLQWHWKRAEPPGEARSDIAIMAGLFLRLRDLYKKEGGAFPDPIVNLNWPYARPDLPAAEEIAKEISGSAVEDVTDPKDPTTQRREVFGKRSDFPIVATSYRVTELFHFCPSTRGSMHPATPAFRFEPAPIEFRRPAAFSLSAWLEITTRAILA